MSRGLWFAMNARTRKSLTLLWTALFLFSLALQSVQLATPAATLAAHLEGIFELDGNADDSAAAGADWENGPEGSLDSFFAGAATEASANDSTYFTTGGSKDENDIPSWAITTNAVPDKDELTDAYAAVYEKNGETWVYFGADRFDNDGDAQIGFWFFQGNVGIANGDFTGNHVDGDVLILSEYTNGGVVDLVCAYEWEGAGGGDNIAKPGNCDPATNGSHLNLVAAGAACDIADGTFDICAVTNDGTANAPWTFTNKDGEHDFAIGQFFEGGINLSDMFGGQPPCFGTFLAETRSSQETDAQLKDFAFGSLDTCVPPDIETHVQQNGQNVSSINKGESVVDVATFDGTNGAVTGSAEFFVCGPSQSKPDCSNGGTQIGGTETIDNETATSDPFTPTGLGWYCFRVEYTPDADSQYLAGEHTNDTTECFRVIPADVQIVKTPNNGTVSAGTDISFTLSWTNEGEGSATGVVVTDSPPTTGGLDWSITGQTGTGSVCTLSAADVLTCDIGKIAGNPNFPNAAPVNGTVTLTSATTAIACGEIDNTGQITSNNDGTDTDPGKITVLCPDVTVAKTPDGGTVTAGDPATFTIVVTNLGPGAATGVTLTDNLPAGYTWTLGGADAADCSINTVPNPDVLSCNFGTLADDETRTITLSAPTTGGNCNVIPNTAVVDATNEPESANGNNSDAGDIDVLCAFIHIEKDANPVGPVNAGDEIGFDVVVSNTGDGAATDVSVDDPLPAGVDWSIDPAVTGCSIDGAVGSQVLSCTRDSLAAGASFTVHVEGVTDAADCGTVDNTASVTSGNDGQDSDGASVDILCPDVQALKTADATPVNAGDQIGFTVTIKNNGAGTAYGATGSDTLPAGIDWSIDGAANGWTLDNGVLTFGPADLAAGASAAVHIVGTTDAADCGVVPNTVTVDATNESNDSSITDDNSASASVTVDCPDLVVVKTAVDDAISAGEVAAFSIDITNIGAGTAYDVSLADTLPGGVAWHVDSVAYDGVAVADPDALCAISGISLSCPDLGDLASGGAISIAVSGDTDLDDCGPIVNSVTVDASNESNEPAFTGNNTDSALIVVDCPELGIDKDADHVDPVLIGNQIGFTVTIGNNGEGTAFDVTVSDTLDSDFSWSIESSDPGWSLVGNVLSFSGDLAAGTTSSVHVVAPTTVGDADQCGLVPNTAVLDHASTDPTPASASETVRCPEIDIVKGADDDLVEPNQTVTFTLDVEVADGPVTDAVITDELPLGQTYITGSAESRVSPSAVFAADEPTVSADGRTLTWDYASLPSGDPALTITYDVTIDADASTATQVNVAEICVAELAACVSDDADVTPQRFGLIIDKTNDAPLEPLELPDGTIVDLPTADEGDTVTYTLAYDVQSTAVTNGVITDVLPVGVSYVDGSATGDAQFTFQGYDDATRTLTWTAANVSEDGSVTYQATVDEGAAELDQPLVNVATIDSAETEPDADDSEVFVPTIVAGATATPRITLPPTDTISTDTPAQGNPGFALMLILLALAAVVLVTGFVTPVPVSVRERSRR
jgi:uncharacterized repeat protein (TIGR01451 family)/fimbrial isopeptide formation D2 family protein